MDKKYFIGLDCGTGSVGWAATDEQYNLLKAKGKTLWGSRLFETANPAAERRLARSSRRRIRRSAERIKLLNLIFQDEIAKVDPEFFQRLQKSFLLEEDKNLHHNSKNTLFCDKNYQDKDFHKQYPTIWHLRHAIITDSAHQHFDIRLYYLAIHHVIKHRGHFLREGEITGAGDFGALFQNFIENAEHFGFSINAKSQNAVEQIICNKSLSIRDRRKQLKETLFCAADEPDDAQPAQDELAGLLAGSKITLAKIFGMEIGESAIKFSCASDSFDEKLIDIETQFDSEQIALLESAKEIYDYGFLSELLNGEEYISAAMVHNYDVHAKELRKSKQLLKPYPEDYDAFFKTQKVTSDKAICYNAYIGNAYTEDRQGRRKSYRVSQEDINKEIKKIFEKHGISDPDLSPKLEQNALLPKQRGQAKGTIPEQLHHNELKIILDHLAKDYPSFAAKTASEPDAYNTKAKKILSLHEFRIPYYCGPLVDSSRSNYSWADEEIAALVRPWNFSELVNLDARAEKFIMNLTNKCTYLPAEDVLPKSSLLYQKYMVLNELNNLKINGRRLDDVAVKQKIFDRAFAGGELAGNITLKSLERWLRDNGYLGEGDILSGTAESKFLPKLSTHRDFVKIFGPDYAQKIPSEQLETVIRLITILSNEPKMLARRITDVLGSKICPPEVAKKLSHKKYTDWAKFSQKFLAGVFADINGQRYSIIEALYSTNHNLMELLSNAYQFSDEIAKLNTLQNPPKSTIDYADVENLYCSPVAKRSIWQSIKLIDDIVKAAGSAPAKIFLESTREDDLAKKGIETTSRYSELKNLLSSPETKELLKELESIGDPRQLRSKKLYLYFTQMGHCAYTGERIELEELMTKAYDIDHIYPRSKTKDDSIRNNLVLVKAEYNRDKTNTYPIPADWRTKMLPTWSYWRHAGLINQEKFNRLTRSTALTVDELSGFIARQIVETSQSVKALRDLLAQKYPDTKIILVKAEQVKDFRNYFAKGNDDPSKGKDVFAPKPEFVKIRELNDLHHAKDAYLNIVVGNVMSETFTDDPHNWFKRNEHIDYSINSHVIWKSQPRPHDYYRGWHYQDSIDIISRNMRRNYVLCTRMPHEQTGAISDLQIVGKTTATKGLIPIKKNLPIEKYGGYNSIKGAYFALIEVLDKKGEPHRKIVQIPILAKAAPLDYLQEAYGVTAKIILPKIFFKSLLVVDGSPMYLLGRTGDSLLLAPALQIFIDHSANFYLKQALKVAAKIKSDKSFDLATDRLAGEISAELNQKLFGKIIDKLQIFAKFPSLNNTITKLTAANERFSQLNLADQCATIANIIYAFQPNANVADLSPVADNATSIGKIKISNDLANCTTAFLMLQSPTGIFERTIDLKTTEGIV